jgi:SagB-type dehydrogenase family enzyme
MLVRRSESLVCFWQGSAFHVRNYVDHDSVSLSAAELQVLDALTYWRELDELAQACPGLGRRRIQQLLHRLLESRIIERADTAADRTRRGLSAWGDWSPAAAYFHFDTKNPNWASPATVAELVALWTATDPVPPETKPARGRKIALPLFPTRGAFPSVLLSRRSWRRFGPAALSTAQLATLLGLTWAAQRWVHFGSHPRLALKTHPSPGACHAIEVYVAAQRVEGLAKGVYQYLPDDHALVAVRRGMNQGTIVRMLGGQRWFAGAAAVMFMTAVFPRVQWKYRSSRAYRSVLLEAGHCCQTFCLTATWLGLAPFCTGALADSAVERLLRIDGATEGVLYAAGVGVRPPKTAWAPYPDARKPRTSLPAYRQRGHDAAADGSRNRR